MGQNSRIEALLIEVLAVEPLPSARCLMISWPTDFARRVWRGVLRR